MDPALPSLDVDPSVTPSSPRVLRALLLGRPVVEGIEVLVWPEEDERRAALAEREAPCLLLVGPDDDPPRCGFLEEWIRLPAPGEDVDARCQALRNRVACATAPVLEPGGTLRFGHHRRRLPAAQLPLAELLVAHYRSVVRREVLAQAYGAAGGTATDEALKAALFRLGQHLASMGLDLRTVRSRGYLLEPSAGCGSAPPGV